MDKQLTPEELVERMADMIIHDLPTHRQLSAEGKLFDYLVESIKEDRAQTEARVRRESLEWISIRERLPTPGFMVLAYGKNTIAKCRLSFDSKFWVVAASNDREPVDSTTHWMPLPLPPEE